MGIINHNCEAQWTSTSDWTHNIINRIYVREPEIQIP